MSEAHSKYSASGFEAARLCPGKPVMEQGKPDNGNAYSREGTAAHAVLERCLRDNIKASTMLGQVIDVEGHPIEVDDEMVDHIQWCADEIRDHAGSGFVLAETRVNYARDIGVAENEGWGTADAIVLRGDVLMVFDLKYGRGVEVDADCDQMKLYALGALDVLSEMGEADSVREVQMGILQPRIRRSASVYAMGVDNLRKWAADVAWNAVEQRQLAVEFKHATPVEPDMWNAEYLHPNEKSCKFCKAKATCPALRNEVTNTVFDSRPATPEDFDDELHHQPQEDDDAAWLAACLAKVDLIEDWCKAVRAEAERRLLAGEEVPGYKLVQGKKGNRQWSDEKSAEQMLKTFRVKLEQMYDMKLISPTSAEKLAKAEVIGKRQWPKLLELITQSAGKPHVAPASDPRPALEVKPVVDDFENLTHDDIA